jgi:hypothetical protein
MEISTFTSVYRIITHFLFLHLSHKPVNNIAGWCNTHISLLMTVPLYSNITARRIKFFIRNIFWTFAYEAIFIMSSESLTVYKNIWICVKVCESFILLR